MFGQTLSQEIDINNIKILLSQISNLIVNRELKNNREEDISFLKDFSQVTFNFVSTVFKGGWDQLRTNFNNKTFQELIKDEFTNKVPSPNKEKRTNLSPSAKLANFSKIPLPYSSRPSKDILEKSKFYGKNTSGMNKKAVESGKPLYAQVSSKNIGNILKIKKNFPELSNKKIKEINKTIFGKADKPRSRINMTTKGPSRKQIIVPISIDNANKFMLASSKYVANLNYSLKSIKTDLMVDFICIDHCSLIVTSNRVTTQLEISIVSKYVKNCNNINVNDIQGTYLFQSKSYLKILSISYILEGTNMPIKSNIIESFIKISYIFNNVNFASKPYIAKVFPKSNMAIVWLDIWDSQCGSTAKKLINCYFNVGSFITTIVVATTYHNDK